MERIEGIKRIERGKGIKYDNESLYYIKTYEWKSSHTLMFQEGFQSSAATVLIYFFHSWTQSIYLN